MRIGPYSSRNNLVLAPMAGVTDRPFRQLCKRLGAGLAVSEMVTARAELRDSAKSRRRRDHVGEVEPRIVQIAGAEPAMMAETARLNVAGNGMEMIAAIVRLSNLKFFTRRFMHTPMQGCSGVHDVTAICAQRA